MALDYRDPYYALAALGGRAPSAGAMILGGQRVKVPGNVVLNWLDGSCAPMATDLTVRHVPPQNITLHTNTGQPHDPLLELTANASNACRLAIYQTTTEREVSWDFTVSRLAYILQQNDPLAYYSWNASQMNGYTLGIETEQGPGGVLSVAAIDALVRLVDALTRSLGIQRQIPAVMVGGRLVPDRRVLARFGVGEGGKTFFGILGHRQVTTNRGPGDPGDAIYQAFLDAGYEGFDLSTWDDYRAWFPRQAALGVPQSGKPGPETVAALKAAGFRHGMFVWRPGD